MSRLVDLTGERFGRLIVLGLDKINNGKSYWKCRCDCGAEKIIVSHGLRSGSTRSCGCYNREVLASRRKIDLADKRFGRLVVISSTDKRYYRDVVWQCTCDCGNICYVSSKLLRCGDVKSCGCFRSDYMKQTRRLFGNKAAQNHVYYQYMHRAAKSDYQFDLSFEFFIDLTQKPCFYCGAKPSKVSKYTGNSDIFVYNGIDRKDNSLGYIESNVVSCCYRCNLAKHTMSIEEFESWIDQVYNTLQQRRKQHDG